MTKEFNLKDKECVKVSMRADELTRDAEQLGQDLKESQRKVAVLEKECHAGKL
jgi:hypothetical protein